jgi:ABC-type transport system involved in multi-copper enzyme maturation permease subunit
MNGWRQSWWRIGWIALDAWRALLRQRLMLVLLLLALLALVVSRALQGIDFGGLPQRFLIELGFAVMALFGSVIAVVGTAQLAHGERESGAMAMVMAKPVRQLEYLLGLWAGVMLFLLAYSVVAGGLLTGLVKLRPFATGWLSASSMIETPVPVGGLIVGAGLQWIKFGVVVAGTLAISSYARSSTFTILLTSVLLALTYLREAAMGAYSAGQTVARTVAVALRLLPDLTQFDLADRVTSAPGIGWAGQGLLGLAGYAAAYVGAYLAVAAWLSRHREG